MKRILPLLLTLCLLLGCFAACGSQAPSGTPAESAASASAAEDTSSAEAPEAPAAPAASDDGSSAEDASVLEEPEEVPQFVTVELPIVDEPTTFSIWYTWPPVLTNFIEGPGATPFAQELAERTGVTIDYQITNTAPASADFP